MVKLIKLLWLAFLVTALTNPLLSKDIGVFLDSLLKVLPFTVKSTIYLEFMSGVRKRTTITLHIQIIKYPRTIYFPRTMQCHLWSLPDSWICGPPFIQFHQFVYPASNYTIPIIFWINLSKVLSFFCVSPKNQLLT